MGLEYKAQLPEIPSSAKVYELETPRVGTRSLLEAAGRLGLSTGAKDFCLSEDWVSYQSGRYQVEQHRKSGALRLRHLDNYGIELPKSLDLSDQDADKIARAFLERTRILPRKEYQLRRVTHLRSGVSDVAGKDRREKILDAGVVYGRRVDELWVEGPGGTAMVNIGLNQEIVGFRSIWRPLSKSVARVKIRPPEYALERMERLTRRFRGDTTVVKAAFGYFEQGEMDRQRYLEPAYAFVYIVQNGEVTHKSAEVIAAGDKTFAPLKGRKRFPSKQEPRQR